MSKIWNPFIKVIPNKMEDLKNHNMDNKINNNNDNDNNNDNNNSNNQYNDILYDDDEDETESVTSDISKSVTDVSQYNSSNIMDGDNNKMNGGDVSLHNIHTNMINFISESTFIPQTPIAP